MTPPQDSSGRARRVAPWLALAAAVAAAVWVGATTASLVGKVAPFWPAAGVGIAGLILGGRRRWPAVLVGAAAGELLIGHGFLSASGLGLGTALESLAAAGIFAWSREWARGRLDPAFTDSAALVAAAAVGAVVGALNGGAVLLACGVIGTGAWGVTAATWWIGDFIGALVVAPLVLSWRFDAPPAVTPGLAGSLRFRVLSVLAAGVGVVALAFPEDANPALWFLVFPLLLLARVRLGGRGAKLVAALVVGLILSATALHGGPFGLGADNTGLLLLSLFLSVVALTGLVLAGLPCGRRMLVPGFVLVGGWMLSGWLFFVFQGARSLVEARENATVLADVEERVRDRLGSYVGALHGGRALFQVSPRLDRARWAAYVRELRVAERYPGVRGVGVILRVAPGGEQALIERMRAGGAPEFRIHQAPESVGGDEPARDRFVIVYSEPESDNAAAIGLDVASEERRRRAAEESRDGGVARTTRPIVLVQDERRRLGFLLLLPMYRPGAPLGTVAERAENLVGWIYAPFVIEDFLSGVLGGGSGPLALRVTSPDMRPGEVSPIVFESPGAAESASAPPQGVADLDLDGLRLRVEWWRPRGQPFALAAPAVWVGASSALASLLLAALIFALQTAGRRAEALAELRTKDLQQVIDALMENCNALAATQGELAKAKDAAEHALRELGHQKFVLDEHAIVAITDLSGRITYANDLFCRISGYRREELVGAHYRLLDSGAHPEAFFHDIHATVARGETWRGEMCNRSRPGALYWQDTTICPFRGRDGAPERYIAIGTDVTQRKLANEKFRVLFEQSGDGYFVLAGDRVLDCNPAAVAMLGLPDREAVEALPVASLRRPADPSASPAGPRERTCYDHALIRPDGSELRVQVSVTPVLLAGNDAELVVWHDIGERLRYQTSLREAKETAERLADQAEAANRAKSEFLAIMSHEIRTPLNSVIGFGELLLSSDLSPDQREWAELQLRAGEDLLSLISDILDFSKMEAGRLILERMNFSVSDLIDPVLRMLGPAAAKKGLAFVAAPPGEPVPELVGDANRLRQVVVNLAANAIKFTERGEVRVRVEWLPLGSGEQGELRLHVSDTGIGFSSEQRTRLFRKFSQADSSTTRRYGGSGLGLAICRQLIEQMGGRITCESEVGRGSIFSFRVPLPVAAPVTGGEQPSSSIHSSPCVS